MGGKECGENECDSSDHTITVIHQSARTLSHIGQWTIMWVSFWHTRWEPRLLLQAKPTLDSMTKEQAVKLGEEFGIIVGEVDEEIRDFLGLERAEGSCRF